MAIIIKKADTKGRKHFVRYTGKNNKVLASTEILNQRSSAEKNIQAMGRNFFDRMEWDETQLIKAGQNAKSAGQFIAWLRKNVKLKL